MSGGTVLVVDSTGSLASVLEGALASAGLAAKTAYNCRQAFDLVQHLPPCLILYDADLNAEMPVEHACQLIRDVPQCRTVPILLVTARADDIDGRVAAAGASGYLQKPVRPEVFFEWLGQHRDMLKSFTAPAPPPPPGTRAPAPPPPPSMHTPPITPPRPPGPPAPSMHTPPVTPPQAAGLNEHFSPVRQPLDRSGTPKPVTLAPELLEVPKPERPPVIDHTLLEVPEEPRQRPPTLLDIEPEPVQDSPNPAPSPSDEGSLRHIVVIDNDLLVQRTLRELVRWRIPYVWAGTVSDGAVLLKDDPPAAIFIEYGMPDMAGDEACRVLKALDNFSDIPIYLMSGNDDGAMLPIVADCNANGHVKKPFTAAVFHAFLRCQKLISVSADRPPSTPAPPPANPLAVLGAPPRAAQPARAAPPTPAAPVTPVAPPLPQSPPKPVVPLVVPPVAPPRASPIIPPTARPTGGASGDDLELDLELPTIDDLPPPTLEPPDIVLPPLASLPPVAAAVVAPPASIKPMSDDEKRLQACLDIGRKKKREALPMLLQLVDEGSSNLVESACWSLGELGDPSAVDVLCKAMRDQPTATKVKALEAIGKIRAFTAVAKIVDFIPKADDKTKLAMIDCLLAIGGPHVKKGLSILSRDFSSSVSVRAHDALLTLV